MYIIISHLKQSLGIGILSMWFGFYSLFLFIGYKMLTHVLKFIHVLLTLSLVGITLACFILSVTNLYFQKRSDHRDIIIPLSRLMLWLLTLAILTGTLFIYPTHFTLQTPWIKAAY